MPKTPNQERYTVVSRFHDSGRAEVVEIRPSKPGDVPGVTTNGTYDEYVDTFSSKAAAESWAADTLNA